ncbi:cytochrome P450 6B5-like [Anticarsia gemmatalis]|uniref:cytochrome P450 6B5-like n=1 Tax=Anticarsia gemmatalis TaxID=129554 RepID=UPI003F77227C
MSPLLILATLLSIIITLIFVLANKKYNYWEKKNVPYAKPLPILGNYAKYILLIEYIGTLVQKLCKQFPNAPYFGTYFGTEPTLVVQDPELLKNIFTKDFYYVSGREISKYTDREASTESIFFTGGDKWKVVRQSLTPLFTLAKMKNMFHLIEKRAHMLEDTLDRETKVSDIVDTKNLSARFTMDCITSCAFGIDANVLNAPVNNPFAIMAEDMFKPSYMRGLLLVLRSIWAPIFYRLGLNCFPSATIPFFTRLLTDVFKSRNYEPSSRNDYVDLVLNLKKGDVITCESLRNSKTGLKEMVEKKVDDELLVIQCAAFFAAGFETSATTMSLTLFELAKKPEVQKRVVQEVDEYLRRHGNKLNYECINELPYLAACISETLRLYPSLGNLTREVMDDYTLPTGLRLDKGIRVHIPVYHLHHNPEYFPAPESYKPERFLPENKDKIIPYTFLPFGEGPKMCIGKQFSLMQVTAGLVTFLKKYEFNLAEGTSETIKFGTTTLTIQPKNEKVLLKLSKRQGWEQRTYVRA